MCVCMYVCMYVCSLLPMPRFCSSVCVQYNTVVSRKYATLPFATLALVQSAEGAYTQDATFSLAITPSLDREMCSASVDVGFILALPFHHGDLEPDCVEVSTWGGWGVGGECKVRGVVKCRTQGGEMLLMLVGDWRASALRGEEAGRFHEVAGVSIVAAGSLCLQ